MSNTATEDDAAETRHFNSCVRAFLEYGQWLAPEFERREQHRRKLSQRHLDLLGGANVFAQRHQTALNCLSTNAALLSQSIQQHINQSVREDWAQQHAKKYPKKTNNSSNEVSESHSHSHSHSHGDGHGHGESESESQCCGDHTPDVNHSQSRLAPERHMVKVRSTLKQCVRDWSSLGKSERDCCYAPLIASLQKYLPVSADNFGVQKVLVPGSGLGRLVFDLATMGYDTQGNEFSYFMLLMGDYIMNRSPSKECFTCHPWLGEANNMMDRYVKRCVPFFILYSFS